MKENWINPKFLVYDGERHKAWARCQPLSEKASEWRVVDLPFIVNEPMAVKWPNRCGITTKLESWMEYRPYEEN